MDIITKLLRLCGLIYPPSLLFILAVPIGFSIVPAFNPNTNSEYFIQELKVLIFWLPFFSSIYLLAKRRVVLLCLSIPLIILGTIEILHLFLIHATVSEASLFAMFDTNPAEAFDFIETSVSSMHYLIAATYIVGCLLLVLKDQTGRCVTRKIQAVAFGVLASILLVVTFKGGEIAFFPIVEAGLLYTKEMENYSNIVERRKSLQRNGTALLQDTRSLMNDEQTYVLIIGESTNKNHTSLYGYSRTTTPNLDSRKADLLVYQDVISPYSQTLVTLQMALTAANKENEKKYYEALSLIDVARASGFSTYWVSNQSPTDGISLLGKTVDKSYFVNLTGSAYLVDRSISRDHKLLPYFTKILGMPARKKLIIVHLMGTHFTYKKRYPSQYQKFRTYTNEKEKIINEYDNSVLYNDYIVSELISQLEQYNSTSPDNIAGLVYLSDHGEEVYDSRDYVGHGQADVSRHHVEIPFLAWVSESFKDRNRYKYSQMRHNLNMPYITDDLFHSMIDFMSISSPQLDPHHSIFSAEFIPKKRMVYGKDYDKELKQPSLEYVNLSQNS